MEDVPSDVQSFLQNHPFLEFTDAKKVKCTLNGHELPCNLTELKIFTSGKKYKKLTASADFSYCQYEPHIVPSTKQPNHLFCKLTLRHLNRLPDHVLRHVNGKRFQRALKTYEECVKQGVEFVPARLKQKRPKDDHAMEDDSGSRCSKKQDGEIWAPGSSGDEGSDSEDSMSDLYPNTLFSLKRPEGEGDKEEEDDFETDEEDGENSVMEVDTSGPQKRKKVQSEHFKKKFKYNRKRKGFKPVGKIKNGK